MQSALHFLTLKLLSQTSFYHNFISEETEAHRSSSSYWVSEQDSVATEGIDLSESSSAAHLVSSMAYDLSF